MEVYRSRSCRDGGTQMESYHYGGGKAAPTRLEDLRSYSVNYGGSVGKEMKMKKVKSNLGSSSTKGWNFDDPELQRKKRVASYKAYAMESKMKGSLKKSFRWIKDTYSQVVYGWK